MPRGHYSLYSGSYFIETIMNIPDLTILWDPCTPPDSLMEILTSTRSWSIYTWISDHPMATEEVQLHARACALIDDIEFCLGFYDRCFL